MSTHFVQYAGVYIRTHAYGSCVVLRWFYLRLHLETFTYKIAYLIEELNRLFHVRILVLD